MAGQHSKRLERFFTPAVRIRGDDYWQRGLVDLIDLDDDGVVATVQGSKPYEVVLANDLDAAKFKGSCQCASWLDSRACKHMWATIRAVEDMLAPFEAEAELAAGGSSATSNAAIAQSRDASTPAPLATPEPSWQRRLAGLVPEDGQRSTLPPRVEYYVEARLWPGTDIALIVHVRTRRHTKDGKLGPARTSPLPMEELARLPAADRSVLALYDRDANNNTYRWERRTMTLRNQWHVRSAMVPALMPLLGATRRTYHGPPPHDDARTVPLAIDVDEPFRFVLYRHDARSTDSSGEQSGEGTIHLTGELRRAAEILPLCALPPGEGPHFLWENNRIITAEFGGGAALAQEIAQSGPIEVPSTELPQLLQRLARLPGAADFLAEEIQRLPETKPTGVVAMKIPKAADAPITARLLFDYDGVTIDRNGDIDDVEPLFAGETLMRPNAHAEKVLAELAVTAGLVPADDAFVVPRESLAEIVGALIKSDLRVVAEGKLVRSYSHGKGNVATGIDWFEVYGSVSFSGHQATLPELLRRKLTPEGFVELGDGSFGMLPVTWVQRLEGLRTLGAKVDGDTLRLPSSQGLLLDAMLSAETNDFDFDRKFADLRKRLAAFTTPRPAPAPATFRGELRPYQEVGAGWLEFLRDFGLGGCLADDMGLGKTVQVLAHLASLPRRRGKNHRPSLLVAPRSIVPNWLAESARFTPKLRVLDFSQPDRWQKHGDNLQDCDLVISTYALTRRDVVTFAERDQRFAYAILDEAQAIKNAMSQTAKAVRLLRAEHRLAMTGTPVENHLGELWSIFEFLNPGMLGRLPAFRALFGADVRGRNLTEHRELVQRALRPVMLRRTKAQVLPDLPAKIEQVIWCDMEAAQRRRYDQLRDHYREALLSGDEEIGNDVRFVALEALLRLRQAACHEGLLDRARRDSKSAKLDVLIPHIQELAEEGHKVLVFSQFTTFLDLVELPLRKNAIAFERIDGKVKDRKRRIERFESDPACPVFLISLKAGGVGLNLTAADYVFLLDPWWNPAVEQQAIDRAHRIGQKRTVHAYRLVCRDTVEERVLELQESKRGLVEAVLGNERSLLQNLTREDLAVLLG